MEEILFSVNQVSILLKVHPLTVRCYIKEGKLKAIKVGENIRIPKSYLDSFSEDVQPTKYGIKSTPKESKLTKEFSLDDPIFRLKGKGMLIRTI